MLVTPLPAWAAPHGGVVTRGNAAISQSGNTTNINQSTPKAAINWQGFSIAPQETVNFKQPSSSSMTLNRVIGNERSIIEGALNANGKVFLINSNGVLFTHGSSVNTAGLVASTLNITDDDFNKGNFVFQGDGQGAGQVINMSTIKVTDGGYVALLGDQVRNEGVIIATRGTVALNSGNRISLNFNGDSLVNVSLDEGTLNALVENKQAILADGGKVILTAKAANDLVGSQVNTSGIIQARTLDDITGTIEVYAHGGTANIDGTLDASAPVSGNGGFIETSGDRVKIADSANIVTKSVNGKGGTWLIDPVDFTVAAIGGDVTGALISNYLKQSDTSNFIISTNTPEVTQGAFGNQNGNGDIFINDTIGWNTASTFTLEAYRDIRINDVINVTGNGTLVMTYGLGDATGDYYIRTPASYSGTVIDPVTGYPVAKVNDSNGQYGSINFGSTDAGGSLYIGGNDSAHKYTLLYSLSDLQGISASAAGRYALAGSLDLSDEYTFTNYIVQRLANNSTFTGLGHTISNFTITSTGGGLFGSLGSGNSAANSGTVRDIGIINPTVSSTGSAGALAGTSARFSIKNAYVEGGTVTGNTFVGGLVGSITGGAQNYTSISDSYSTAAVTGHNSVGGLVGYAFITIAGDSSRIAIIRSHATGSVTAVNNNDDPSGVSAYIGGLIGDASNSNIIDSYALGNVTVPSPLSYVGGLAGHVGAGPDLKITNSFATGNVSGFEHVGGLLGGVDINGAGYKFTLTNSYATGNVSSSFSSMEMNKGYVGGLIGQLSVLSGKASLSRVYARGDVTTPFMNNVGGLIGSAAYTDIEDAYATGNVTVGDETGGGGEGYIGGLVGQFAYGDIRNSYATGNVWAPSAPHAGGLVGIFSVGNIESSYATGDVTGYAGVGGLVGLLQGGNISDSYAAGLVTAICEGVSNAGLAGGLVGYNSDYPDASSITNSYWNEANAVGVSKQGGGSTIDAASRGLSIDQLNDTEITTAITTADGDVSGAIQNRENRLIQAENDRLAEIARLEQEERDRVAAEAARLESEAAAQAAAEAVVRQEAVSTATTVADNQTTGAIQLASAVGIQIPELTPASLDNAIDVASAPAREQDASYNAGVKQVTVDGVTFLVSDSDEESAAR
ncbi:MAG: filamentous hemagglutinin N-terminal domain-containing protein [Candidatus Accumulibacter sp.]|nr:filamentous hemagglutinin N-terminal domain-containing protein [Accumulibacter sp.]